MQRSVNRGVGGVERLLNRFGHAFGPFIMEFIGSLYLVLTIQLVSTNGAMSVINAVSIGGTLLVMVFAGGPVSGAHYNPAVSWGVFLSGRGAITFGKMLAYWLVQMLGGISGAAIGHAMTSRSALPSVGPGYTEGQALMAESLFTFLLATVVLNVTAETSKGNSYYGLGIGFTVLSGIVAVGPISGAVFNPAVLGLNFVHHAVNSDDDYGPVWIYLVGPFLGATVASAVFRITNPEEYDEMMQRMRDEDARESARDGLLQPTAAYGTV